MSKTLIGIVSYGGLPFLRMLIREIHATTTREVDIAVVVAKPGDEEMLEYLRTSGRDADHPIIVLKHAINFGFPSSVNSLYDIAFEASSYVELSMASGQRLGRYDNLIICGNDTVPMPGCIDAMIKCAEETDWETISATEFDSRSLVAQYPEAAQFFHGPNHAFVDFSARPWEIHKYSATGIQPDCFKDVRNMTLYKRSAFDKTGYADANFWPNGYFEDNDIAHRCVLAGVKSAGLLDASFFHFWSRTIHQGEARPNNVYFERNRAHYIRKWGGEPFKETYALPYQGDTLQLNPKVFLPGTLKISSRTDEMDIVKYWSKK